MWECVDFLRVVTVAGEEYVGSDYVGICGEGGVL